MPTGPDGAHSWAQSIRRQAGSPSVQFSPVNLRNFTPVLTIGGFDEVSAGGSWLNTAAIDYVWREANSIGATPQVVIALRTIRKDSPTQLRIPPITILVRMLGTHDITSMAGLQDVDSLLLAQRPLHPTGAR